MWNHEEHSSDGLPNGDHHQQQTFVPKSSYSTLSDSFRPPYPFWWEEISSRSGSNGSFLEYIPQYEQGGVESQTVVDLLNRECSRLLDLNSKDFWKQVANDTSLYVFLESFLKYRRRWYDLPYHGVRGTVAEVIVGEHELSRRVFMIFYRISSNQDSGAQASDSLSAEDHGVILQEKNLLGMAKLLDICAIYGHENEELTRLLVTNAIKAQPKIHYRFTSVTTLFLYIVDSMYERCGTSLEVLFSSHEAQDGFTRIHTYYLEVMDFVNDVIVSMDAFINAHKYAAVYFCCPVETSDGRKEVLKNLARLHDSLLPSLQQGFKKIFSAKKDGSEFTSSDMLPNIVTSLNTLSSRIVAFCWKLLNLCYLSEDLCGENTPLPRALKTFPANVKDPIIKAKNLAQRLIEISVESSRTAKEGGTGNSLLQSVDKKYQLMGRLELLSKVGWMSVNDKQLQLLSDIIWVPRKYMHHPSATDKVEEMDEEDNAVMASKISQVKDQFPDYGKGFISACLRVYNHSPEEVIQRILEGTLRSDLLSLYTWVPPKYVSNKDKGKGILVELPNAVANPQLEESTTNVPDPQIQDETSKNFDLQVDSLDNLRLSDDELNEKVTCMDTSALDAERK